MRLGNILSQQGGVAETGRPVKFQLRQKVSGKTVRKWCEAAILPIGEDERARASAAARRYCAEQDDAADFETERCYRLVQLMLHDPQDLRVKYVTEQEVPLLRQGLVWPQVKWLLQEYDRHIEAEYPEILSQPEGEALEKEAEGNSDAARP